MRNRWGLNPGGERLRFVLPGCVSVGSENRLILKGLNNENLDPYTFIEGLYVL